MESGYYTTVNKGTGSIPLVNSKKIDLTETNFSYNLKPRETRQLLEEKTQQQNHWTATKKKPPTYGNGL